MEPETELMDQSGVFLAWKAMVKPNRRTRGARGKNLGKHDDGMCLPERGCWERLSRCVFDWSEDLKQLKTAKRNIMISNGIACLSDSDVFAHITKKKLSLHCNRRTRDPEDTIKLISELIDTF
uniref:Uncharacterized protein n=1 Tax=Branchiostoma floridae TaxID=7739 RepID=C3ZYJ4_BRAFL|eukprot:XP_002586367.1 hypothetical protein BRAFLDRAFT_108652 [Branchiostoma floridae]